jgi:spectinomycin phosphotransferase
VESLPDEFDVDALRPAIQDCWGLAVEGVEYAPVGAGSYHWLVDARGGRRFFVTVDDLDRKPWLGDSRDSVFDGLKCAFDTALALRHGGLGFVVAPIPTSSGQSAARIGARHSIALFPLLDGVTGQFGLYGTEERAAVQTLLGELHLASTPASARRLDLGPPGRGYLESALEEFDDEWLGGPLSEPARHAFSPHASAVAELIALADRLASDLPTDGWVVTHGEPHAANLMRTESGHCLLDWDTVAVAPRERDLWMLVDPTAEEPTIYTGATGYQLDGVTLRFFRLSWNLADLAAFISVLRSPHSRNVDTENAYEGLLYCLSNAADDTTR